MLKEMCKVLNNSGQLAGLIANMANEEERERILNEWQDLRGSLDKNLNRYKQNKLTDYLTYNIGVSKMISLDQTKKKHHKEELEEYKKEITKLCPWLEKNFNKKELKMIKRCVEIDKRLCYIGMFSEDDLTVE